MLSAEEDQLSVSSSSSSASETTSLYPSSDDDASITSGKTALLQDILTNLRWEIPSFMARDAADAATRQGGQGKGDEQEQEKVQEEEEENDERLAEIFAEADTGENIVLDCTSGRPGRIVAATVPKLVERLTTTIDSSFMEDFLMGYRSFLKPARLARYLAFRLRQGFLEQGAEAQSLKLRTFVVLRQWMRGYYDVDFGETAVQAPILHAVDEIWTSGAVLTFSDKQILAKLRRHVLQEEPPAEETSGIALRNSESSLALAYAGASAGDGDGDGRRPQLRARSWAHRLGARIAGLLKGLHAREQEEDEGCSLASHSFDTAPSPPDQRTAEGTGTAGGRVPHVPWMVEDAQKKYGKHSCLALESSETLAQHLCLIESKYFHALSWKELLRYPGGTGERQIATSLQSFVDHFNQMCLWIISEITQSPSHHEQALIIKKLVRISLKCLGYANFNSVMQIILALQNAAVECIYPAWQRLSEYETTLFDDLVTFCSPARNFKNIRRAMELQELSRTPCIPFTGLFLSDLASNNERSVAASAPRSAARLVPWFKHQTAARIIRQFQAFQAIDRLYSFDLRPELYWYLARCCQAVQDDQAS